LESPFEIEFCRRCRRDTRWTRSGGQNGSRPVATFWRCAGCGSERVALTNVSDVEGLALTVVAERRRSASADVESARLDYEDAVGHVVEAIYAAYVEWDPTRNPSFLSWAMFKGRCALTDWYRDLLGRDTPKAHAWAIDLDSFTGDTDEDEVRETNVRAPAALAEASISHAILLIEDEETSETLRAVVQLIALGFSHAEVAAMNGQTEAWVSARLRKLRTREDLRVPA